MSADADGAPRHTGGIAGVRVVMGQLRPITDGRTGDKSAAAAAAWARQGGLILGDALCEVGDSLRRLGD